MDPESKLRRSALSVQTAEGIKAVASGQFQRFVQLVDVRSGITAHQFTGAGMTVQTEDEVFLCTFVQQFRGEVVPVLAVSIPAK